MNENQEYKSRDFIFPLVLKYTKENWEKHGGEGEKESKCFCLSMRCPMLCHQKPSVILWKTQG